MIGLLRIIAVGAGALLVWLVLASQTSSHIRLPLDGVVAGAVVTQKYGCTSLALEPFDPFCPGRHINT
ncbi:MAG: hypothetical protein ACREP9_19410, partial [Candidatus Dormibacteraceae bacterium]